MRVVARMVVRVVRLNNQFEVVEQDGMGPLTFILMLKSYGWVGGGVGLYRGRNNKVVLISIFSNQYFWA